MKSNKLTAWNDCGAQHPKDGVWCWLAYEINFDDYRLAFGRLIVWKNETGRVTSASWELPCSYEGLEIDEVHYWQYANVPAPFTKDSDG